MSATGRPEREYRSAQHEGSPASATGRPEREYRSAEHEGNSVNDTDPGAAFRLPVRAYYEDTDAAGVVYYANYLKFLERARTEWLAARGFDLAALERGHGIAFVVHRVEIDYLRPARLGDRLEATFAVVEGRRSRLVARQEIYRGAERLVSALVTIVCVDQAHWKPVRIPPALLPPTENPA